ncbi:MAG: HD domain-containing protein [Promethearchaeota archaeon]|nr:MAG: HD domain-containing protein [Candidatus Lokiarchaeota archaeon]
MKQEELLKKIKNFALEKLPSDDIHGYGHTERVYLLSVKIGQKMKANMLVLKVAVFLHDIGRYSKEIDRINVNHAEISAKIAANYLRDLEFQFKEKDFENVIHCIQTHSYSNQKLPQTLEAKILSDADKLDALGAIGLYRTIGYTTKMNGNLQDVILHLKDKLFKLHTRLFLDISKKLAQKRLLILEEFYEEIKNELKNHRK